MERTAISIMTWTFAEAVRLTTGQNVAVKRAFPVAPVDIYRPAILPVAVNLVTGISSSLGNLAGSRYQQEQPCCPLASLTSDVNGGPGTRRLRLELWSGPPKRLFCLLPVPRNDLESSCQFNK